MTNIFIVSYPKCGRTWLRLMLGKALAYHFGLTEVNLLELAQLAANYPKIPHIELTHDHNAHYHTPSELSPLKTEYANKKVILLVRDVRDVVVSYYFEVTKRRKFLKPRRFQYDGDLSSFLRYEKGSVATIITFYNIWAANRHLPTDFLLNCIANENYTFRAGYGFAIRSPY